MVDASDAIVSPEDSLTAAMGTIDANNMGVVFVTDEDGHLEGVATDGDIRRGLLAGEELSDPVRTVLNEDPIVIRSDWDESEIHEHIHLGTLKDLVGEHNTLWVPVLDEADRVVDAAFVDHRGEIVDYAPEDVSPVERVLIIGGAGYIGSVLSRELLDAGYEVRVLDNLLFGDRGVADLLDHERFELHEGDMRDIENVVDAIGDVDAVVHLGALVGDPASAIDAQKTLEMNYHSTKMIAEICKYHQINRFIFASTCSVYGKSESPEDLLTEQSPLNPVSLYAKTKLESERALLEMADSNFSPTIFRMATIYGLSPRMRFDLVVNILSAKATLEDTVPIFGGGQYRPNVHVRDAARAYIAALDAPIEDVAGEIFNVGSNAQNYQIIEIGEMIADRISGATIDVQEEKEDERSYQVDFTKIEETLDYEVQETIPGACDEIVAAIQAGQFEDYTDAVYNNYRTIRDESDIVPTPSD